ncbi:hypothetical protein Tco_0807248 [Tanacetum coccineum]
MFKFDEGIEEMLVKHCLVEHELEQGDECTCNNDKNLSKRLLGQEWRGESKVVIEIGRMLVLESRHLLHFEGGDCGEEVVLLQTCLTEILGFLEKFGGGFEEDMRRKEW